MNCENCKDLIRSVFLISHSIHYQDLSDTERIDLWQEDANTFTERADLAYSMRKNFLRTHSVEKIAIVYRSLRSSSRSFLLGGIEDDENLELAIEAIKGELLTEAKYFD